MATPSLTGPLSSAASSVTSTLPSGEAIGDFIREQRESAKLSLRRLAEEAGVSNPYLSQIERGLRKPSAEILQQLAKALRISAEQLYVQAGLLEDRGSSLAVEAAVLSDPSINERQKRVLLDIYASFLSENGVTDGASADAATAATKTAKKATRRTTKKAAKKTAATKPPAKKRATKKTIAKKTTKKSTTKKSPSTDRPSAG
jgi:transcriptional regulator with XRE-family HTH domain